MNSPIPSAHKHPSFSPYALAYDSQNLKISKNLFLLYKSNTHDLQVNSLRGKQQMFYLIGKVNCVVFTGLHESLGAYKYFGSSSFASQF